MSRSTPEWIGKTDNAKIPPRVRLRSICSIDGCKRYVTGKGLCNMHYRRMRRHGDPLAGGTPHGEVEAFLAAALSSKTDDCIVWPYGTSNGYGSINSDQFGTKYAHIYVCEKAHGPKPSDLHLVCHAPVICHNSACINPRHIRWDTQKANRDDAILDGTINRGEKGGGARLTESEVVAIRSSSLTRSILAKQYGVSPNYISEIRSGKTVWRHV